MLRAGGNAVDAAVACVLMSFVAESPLTGPGAGGFMLVHTAGGEDHLLDFFVAAPGTRAATTPSPAALTPIDVHFSEDAVQRFNVGPSSCGAYGTTLGLGAGARALRQRRARRPHRRPGARRRARASRWCRCRPSCSRSSSRSSARRRSATRSVRARRRAAARGRHDSASRSSATCSSGSAPRGPASSTRATSAGACSDWVLERGGLLTREDLAAYEVVEREPARVTLPGPRGAHQPAAVVGRHPDRGRARHPRAPRAPARRRDVIAEVIASTNRARDEEFLEGLATEGYLERFLRQGRARLRGDRGALAARQHDPHRGDGRRRRLRVGHLLERLLLGRRRARHRACTSTTCSASRTSTRSATTATSPARACRA